MSTTLNNVLELSVPVKRTVVPVEQEAVNSPSKVDNLALQLQTLKAEKAALTSEIARREDELLSICGHEEEGSRKFNTDNFVITTTGKLTRKVTDAASILALAPEVCREKIDVDVRKLRTLATSNPMLYKKVLQCMEIKPAKAALKIEPVQQKEA